MIEKTPVEVQAPVGEDQPEQEDPVAVEETPASEQVASQSDEMGDAPDTHEHEEEQEEDTVAAGEAERNIDSKPVQKKTSRPR